MDRAPNIPTIGAEVYNVAGMEIPLMATVFGIAGVILGRYIAQAAGTPGVEAVSPKVSRALAALFSLTIIAAVSAFRLTPFHALGWGAGLGFIGLSAVKLLGQRVLEAIKVIFTARSNNDNGS